ncbi:RecQ family ATP-dependent DNA helicase [Hymenobacter sp. 15J16-1T3B]|uniref:RecQ family ATP-dependent DNA helicase n=1 Tax=Hymenobacter sp. 15J16-1T3B TaxID=2886941 RepID=UPI001D1306F8|nr:RecQ family ATP-dependent DNA helicase [Hymenobacter sp. 15J16-1T3B]MCC3160211.1 RecQ family ATP-dependent DNA helicase [Hymenobacter sp. 15J16-1T3B]
MLTNAQELLRQHFPLLNGKTLKPFQERVITHVVEDGSTVAVMPTGGGKSWIYWVAGKARGGTTVVIAPLVALMDEQAAKLTEQGCRVLTIHASVPASEQVSRLTAFGTGQETPDFLFLSPERVAIDGYLAHCLRARRDAVRLVVVDEAHCISQWGFDFRPFYQRIPQFLDDVFGAEKWPPILGLTATINPRELGDILTDFRIDAEHVLRDRSLLRHDLRLHVERFTSEEKKEERLWELLTSQPPQTKTLVYLYRKYNKRGVEDLAVRAQERGLNATHFHGDMSAAERQNALHDLRSGNTTVVFATNAFGMGIDIPDIRTVIHFMMPESVEQYYQEVGRGGRDHQGADCWLLYSKKNVQVRRDTFIDKSFPKAEELAHLYHKLASGKTTLQTWVPFADDEVLEALPFFLEAGLVSLEAKGFNRLDAIQVAAGSEVHRLQKITPLGTAVVTLNRSPQLTPAQFFSLFYEALRTGAGRLAKGRTLDKCLLIRAGTEALSTTAAEQIEAAIAEKRAYKHNLLDQLLHVLDSSATSEGLHGAVGDYLKVSPAGASPVLRTLRGEWVRSKSEVIIANLLHKNGADYAYERPIYQNGKYLLLPDFTVTTQTGTYYWEHLGLLDDPEYARRWAIKQNHYKRDFPGYLITTEENASLSQQAQHLIDKILGN